MKYKDIEKFDKSVLNDELLKHKKELLNLRFQKTLGELTNLSRIKQVKTVIARLKTKLNNLKN